MRSIVHAREPHQYFWGLWSFWLLGLTPPRDFRQTIT
jgi:hypothetical protein